MAIRIARYVDPQIRYKLARARAILAPRPPAKVSPLPFVAVSKTRNCECRPWDFGGSASGGHPSPA